MEGPGAAEPRRPLHRIRDIPCTRPGHLGLASGAGAPRIAVMPPDTETPSNPSLPPPLRRASAHRWIGGVCRGVATRWDISVAHVRALFVVATLLAGLGMLAYVACWLVLPTDSEDDESPSLVRGMASLALLAAASAGLATLALGATGVTLFGFGWGVVGATAVFLVAALVAWPLLRLSWVLLPLAAILIPAVAVAASGLRIAPQAGVVVGSPERTSDVPARGYRTGLGDLLVDLRGFRAPAGSEVPLRLDTGTGRTVVALPRDRCFNLDVRYKTDTLGWDTLTLTAPWSEPRERPTAPSVFYGRDVYAPEGRWTRPSSDRNAPTLRIDFTSVDGSLWIRDYPDATGPLYESDWPDQLNSPASPGELRLAWRESNRKPAVQRRWKAWRKAVRRFERQQKARRRGACAIPRKPA